MNNLSEIAFLYNLSNLNKLYLSKTNIGFRFINFSVLYQFTDLVLSENKDDNKFTFVELNSLSSINLNHMSIKSIIVLSFIHFYNWIL